LAIGDTRPGAGNPGGRRAVEVPIPIARAWRAAYAPGAVWLQLGTNDLAGDGGDAKRGWLALAALARELATWGVPLSIATLPPLRDRVLAVDAWNDATRALADDVGAQLVDLAPVLTLAELPDGVHASGAGYARLARRWVDGPTADAAVPFEVRRAAGSGVAVLGALVVAYLWSQSR
jgi:hypothetical protein